MNYILLSVSLNNNNNNNRKLGGEKLTVGVSHMVWRRHPPPPPPDRHTKQFCLQSKTMKLFMFYLTHPYVYVSSSIALVSPILLFYIKFLYQISINVDYNDKTRRIWILKIILFGKIVKLLKRLISMDRKTNINLIETNFKLFDIDLRLKRHVSILIRINCEFHLLRSQYLWFKLSKFDHLMKIEKLIQMGYTVKHYRFLGNRQMAYQ